MDLADEGFPSVFVAEALQSWCDYLRREHEDAFLKAISQASDGHDDPLLHVTAKAGTENFSKMVHVEIGYSDNGQAVDFGILISSLKLESCLMMKCIKISESGHSFLVDITKGIRNEES